MSKGEGGWKKKTNKPGYYVKECMHYKRDILIRERYILTISFKCNPAEQDEDLVQIWNAYECQTKVSLFKLNPRHTNVPNMFY